MLALKQLIKEDPKLAELSEKELVELRQALYEGANLAFDLWHQEKFGSKNPIRCSAQSK